MDASAAKRWMLGLALGSVLFGLVSKLTDPRGDHPHRRAAPSASTPREEAGASVANEADRPRGVIWPSRDLPSGVDDRGGVGRKADASAAAIAQPLVPGSAREGSLGGHRHAHHRARMRAAGGGSLATSAVGDAAAGAALGEPRAGETAAGGKPTGAADTRAAEAAPPPADIAFASGDAQYQTEAQVEAPDVGKIGGSAGTMSFWLQPAWQEGNQDDATLMELGDGHLKIIKNVGFLRFEFVDDAGNTGGVGASIAEWKEGEWHQVTATWGGNRYALYLDGQLVSQTTHDGHVDLPPDAKLYIGSNFPENRPVASGTMWGIHLRNRPLGPREVGSNFNAVVRNKNAALQDGWTG